MNWLTKWLSKRMCPHTTAEITAMDGGVQIEIIHKCNGVSMARLFYGPQRAREFADYVKATADKIGAA